MAWSSTDAGSAHIRIGTRAPSTAVYMVSSPGLACGAQGPPPAGKTPTRFLREQKEIRWTRSIRQNEPTVRKGRCGGGIVKTSWRALVAVILLAGFPVLVLLVVGGLAVAEYYAFQHSGL